MTDPTPTHLGCSYCGDIQKIMPDELDTLMSVPYLECPLCHNEMNLPSWNGLDLTVYISSKPRVD